MEKPKPISSSFYESPEHAWVEWLSPDASKVVVELGRIAAQAIREEDKSLAAMPRPPEEAAPGLTYWCYETTLVYLIFKAWSLEGHTVRWDYVGTDGHPVKGGREPELEEAKNVFRGALDLVVDVAGAPRRYAFEAKWWNLDVRRRFYQDANKLRSWKENTGHDGYHIAFWWANDGKLQGDVASADAAVGSRYVYRTRWRTKDERGVLSRWFVMEIFAPQ